MDQVELGLKRSHYGTLRNPLQLPEVLLLLTPLRRRRPVLRCSIRIGSVFYPSRHHGETSSPSHATRGRLAARLSAGRMIAFPDSFAFSPLLSAAEADPRDQGLPADGAAEGRAVGADQAG
jgi:hypothetical protein